MRGLTAAERRELLSWNPGSAALSGEAIDSLVANGRAVWVTGRYGDARRTDMAHLALRVCPVGEP